ncbi:MAG: LamG domain-containing protein [bacterium]|nr:LamG domain-containing protein [bacterium]MDW8164603.1 LamG-like jellyroll fold domain-containing protein [Candidatus Omnitrophota bacterium]
MIKESLILIFSFSVFSFSQVKFSWEETHCEITSDGDIKWKPKPFIFEKGSSVRYIDYDNGNDNNDGLTAQTPWKHHPWDEKAEGKAKECKGVHTYIFKKGVIYRGKLVAKESGKEGEPIRLTVDPNWGQGEAYIYGSMKIEGGWRRNTERLNVPESDKIWYIDLKEDFVPRAVWLVEGNKITRIPIARQPNWVEDGSDDVMKNWWVWEKVTTSGSDITGKDSKNLTNPDPNYYKNAIVWTEGSNLIVTPTPSRITNYNPQTNEITFRKGWREAPVRGCRYFIEDKIEFLDSPGEYYYHPGKRRLYIRLPNDEDPNTKTIEIAKEFNLIEIPSQSNIEISGLSFRFNNSLPDPMLRWIDTTDIYTAAIRAIGTCKNIKIHHNKFEYLTKGVRFYTDQSSDIIDKIEISDNEFSYIDHNSLEFKDNKYWGRTIPPFGKIREVKVLRNKFYNDGIRPLRDYTPFTIWVSAGEIVEIAGNILERCYGGGINVLFGKQHDLRDCPLIKGFIHHNKVKDCLLNSNDYGGIEIWEGGPAIVYNNIVINPVGPRIGNYVSTVEGRRDPRYNTSFGFAYYSDGQYKSYLFNNLAIGKYNKLGEPLLNAAAYMQVGCFLSAYFNNFAYKFGCAFRKQPSLNGVQRAWYLGNYIVDISDVVFDHQAAGESKPEIDKYDTVAYLDNIFSGNPKTGLGSFAPKQPIAKTFEEFSEYLKSKGTLRYEIGKIKEVPQKLEDMIKDYVNNIRIKFFVPYPLYKVVGEWNFYKNSNNPTFIFGENLYFSDEYMDRTMYHLVPWNNLRGMYISEENYKNGILENWIEGALEFDGEKVYCILPDSEIKRDYSFVYPGSFSYGEIGRNSEVVYPGDKRQTVDMDKNSFLIEVIMKVDKGEGVIVEKMKEGKGYSVYLKDGRVNFKIGYGKDYYLVYTDKKIDDGRWHHLVVELDTMDKVSRIYIDGKEEKVIKEGMVKEESISNRGDFIVGKGEIGYFKGLIDYLRVSRGSLKDAQTTIEELYKWEFDGPFLKDFFGNKKF